MKMLVTGCQGQVARSLAERARGARVAIRLAGRPELDLCRPETIAAAVERHAPEVIVSAAAYTAVDRAETERELAWRVNAEAPGHLARAAAAAGIPIIHLSTDYVFDGSGERPWRETDATAPLGVYGRTKLAGEAAVIEAGGRHVILRTAWVYSPFGSNFLRTMLRLAEARDEIGVVADQVGNPTSALDIADGVMRVAANLLGERSPNATGVFHMAGSGETSWAGMAEHVFACSQECGLPSARVLPISTADYPTPAQRPANSRLDCTRLGECHGVTLPDWRASVRDVVARLGPSAMVAAPDRHSAGG